MQLCSVHWLRCSKLMTKKRKKSWRNEKEGGFAEGLRGASSSAHFMLWWMKLKWRTPEHLQTLSGWIHSNFNIFIAVKTKGQTQSLVSTVHICIINNTYPIYTVYIHEDLIRVISYLLYTYHVLIQWYLLGSFYANRLLWNYNNFFYIK